MSTDNNINGAARPVIDGLIQSRFRANDMELLKTGQFSDARLTLGGAAWQVHKSIICLRSGFMKDAFCPTPREEKETLAMDGWTEKQVDLLLEFIYSGSIKAIDDLSLPDCVQLCTMAHGFRVDGMIWYSSEHLWYKLTPMLRALSSMPATFEADQSWSAIADSLNKTQFIGEFKEAIFAAYRDPECHNACRLILADFVWAARTWLLCDPVIDELNTAYPLFGSHVLTTVQKGPQSPFPRLGGNLKPDPN